MIKSQLSNFVRWSHEKHQLMEQVHMTQQIIICIRLARNSGLGVAPIEFGCESDQLLGSGLVELVRLLLTYL